MAIEGFDYNAFAQNLASQAVDLVPQDFTKDQKAYVTNTLLNFSTLAGEALYNDKDLGFNADQAAMITQIIAEWSFHKSVDLIRSGIPQQFWDPVMQKIAFTIFEIAKQTFKQGLPQDQILQLIEHHVKKTYLESIQELKDKGFIDEALMEIASHQSNIDSMMQQMQENGEVQPEDNQQAQNNANAPAPQQQPSGEVAAQQAPSGNVPAVQGAGGTVPVGANGRYEPPKLLKLVTVALLLKRMDDEEQVQSILERFEQEDAGTVIKYMYVDNLEEQVDPTVTMKFLDEIAENLPQAIEVNKKRILQSVKETVDKVGRNTMERKLQLERQKVRQFVFNAIEDEYYKGISPKIANIIATYLASGV